MPRPAGARPASARWVSGLIQAAALAAGALLLLVRVSPRPAWRFVYGEDFGIYLPGAMAHPWHLLTPYAGYVTLLPRLIGQFVAMLPVRYAGAGFAVAGALIASGCALFTYHASAGHIASRPLRALLGLSVVLLPVAPLEIADSGENSLWYLLATLFWAVLWRPRSRSGAAAAALIAFMAAASVPLAFVYAPLLAARAAVVPRRAREHAVTAGWAVGCVFQALVIPTSHVSRTGRLDPVNAVTFYTHEVLLPALGWHLAWHLRAAIGLAAATLLVGGFLTAVLGYATATEDRRRMVFQATAVVTGLVFALAAGSIGWAPSQQVTPATEPGARYSTVPILLLDAALLAAADAFIRRRSGLPTAARPRAQAVAAALIVAVLAAGWITDFRYTVARSLEYYPAWSKTSATWLRHCERDPAGSVTMLSGAWYGPRPRTTFACSRLHR